MKLDEKDVEAVAKARVNREENNKTNAWMVGSVIAIVGGVLVVSFSRILGWAVSVVINRVVNYFLAKQGVPYIPYFSFPVWLALGAIAFSVAVSLAAGVYPAMRAARVDPVRALRHD